jgi:hypothetical protein
MIYVNTETNPRACRLILEFEGSSIELKLKGFSDITDVGRKLRCLLLAAWNEVRQIGVSDGS